MAGKTIKLFFVDGEPSGLRVADVMNWAGIALAVPRNHLRQFKARREASRPGVYILLGDDPDVVGEVRGYIGETEALGPRLAQNAREPTLEWWTEAVVFTSKDGSLTKAHAKHLELALHRLASEAARVNLTNVVAPSGAALPESDLDAMESFLKYMRLTLPPLSGRAGQMFEPRSGTRTRGPEFTFSVLNAQARMRRSSEGYVVLRGSTAVRKVSDSLSRGYRAIREGLMRDGTLTLRESDDLLVFNSDAAFTSSSAAAGVVAGSSQSGPAGWRLPDGTSLGAVEAAELE